MKRAYIGTIAIFFIFSSGSLLAQFYKVSVVPDRKDWTYKTGEKAKFTISVIKDGVPQPGAVITYVVQEEKMPDLKKETITLQNGTVTIEGGTMKQPGFLRCIATSTIEQIEYRGLGTAGFEPNNIKPTVDQPGDFDAFWKKSKEELATLPVDARLTPLPEQSTSDVNVYHISLQNINNSRVFGILCVPKQSGKYPALLRVPGAGVRPYTGDIELARKGIITLTIGIHGIPVMMEPTIYTNLGTGALNGYMFFNLDDREKYYYKRVYLGCVRAVDFLTNMPEFDGKNIGVAGGSQGGALSIVTAALDPRISVLAAHYPALCDLTGYLNKRAGGWPHLFREGNLLSKERIETSKYFDAVNFSRRLKVPGFYSWGYNDETCPPTSMYAAYNEIRAPKELYLVLETGHFTYPEQVSRTNAWLLEKLRK